MRFLDRFFDLHVQGNMQPTVNNAIRPGRPGRPLWRRAWDWAKLRVAYDWLEENLPDSEWAAGDTFTLADCAAAPALFYADWIDEIGDGPPAPHGVSGAPARPSRGRSEVGRGRAALPPLFPARRARPRLSEGGGLPEQLIGLDHLAELRFVAAVAAILVGVIAADQHRIALAQRMAVGIFAEAEHRQRAPFGAVEPRR